MLQGMRAGCGVAATCCLFAARVLVQKWVHTAVKEQLATTCILPGSRNVVFWLSCAELAAYCHEIAASYL